MIRDSFSRIESERSFLFAAVARFDRKLAEKLADEFAYLPMKDDDTSEDDETEFTVPEELADMRRRFSELDRQNMDYIIHLDRMHSDDSEGPFWESVDR